MADRKITDLTALAAGSQATGDLLTIVDVSEGAAADKNKKITIESLFKGIPGNVGIGTSSPSTRFHLTSTDDNFITLDHATRTGSWIIKHSGTNSESLEFQQNNGSTTVRSYLAGRDVHEFHTNGSERLRIDSSGRVMIGTTTNNGGFLTVDAGGSSNIAIRDDSIENHKTNGNGSIVINYSGYQAGTTQFRDLAIYNGKQQHIATFDGSTSRVGIGTSSPSESLEVAGSGLKVTGQTSGVTDEGLTIDWQSLGNSGRLFSESAGDSTMVFYTTSSGTRGERVRIQSAGGISFNGDTAAANALDDYEEGTFTVTYVPASGSFTAATYAEQNGSYTKIGNRLFFNLRIRTSGLTKGTASGDLKISGLPYDVINDSTNGRNAISISLANEWAGDVPSGGHCQVNTNDLFLLYRDASDGAALSVTVDDMATGTNKNQVWITGSYRVS